MHSPIPYEQLPQGWFYPPDIAVYRDVFQNRVPRGGRVVEVGTYRGRSMASVADIIREKEINFHAIDTYEPYLGDDSLDRRECVERTVSELGLGNWVRIHQDSSVNCAKVCSDQTLDFVFLDGDHSYEAVTADIRAWLPKLKPEGWLGGHDYRPHPGVTRAVDELEAPVELDESHSMWLVRADLVKLKPPKVIKLGIARPSYQGGLSAWPLLNAMSAKCCHGFLYAERASSLLTYNHNQCWCWALNNAARGEITHLLMMHADISPQESDWLDTLYGEMVKANADVISAIVPIKDGEGFTSTGIDTDDVFNPIRFTQRQVNQQLPVTWTCEGLLVNDGFMLVDMTKPWVTHNYFDQLDTIVQKENGDWIAHSASEDWNFSRRCHRLGARVYATRAVVVGHMGINTFPSSAVWGRETDPRWEKLGKNVEIISADGEVQSVKLAA